MATSLYVVLSAGIMGCVTLQLTAATLASCAVKDGGGAFVHCWYHVAAWCFSDQQLRSFFLQRLTVTIACWRSAVPEDITPPGYFLDLIVVCRQIVPPANCSFPLSVLLASKSSHLPLTTFVAHLTDSPLFLLFLACNM